MTASLPLGQAVLMSQLRDIEARLDGVGVVRSPYPGKIKWIAQSNQELMVELVIVIAES